MGLTALETGRSLVLRCVGDLCTETLPLFQQALARKTSSLRFVLFDLTAARYADPAALRWLLQLRAALEEQNTELRVVLRPDSRIRRALALCGFASLFAL